mmetsp:Transcript_8426/g.21520  ORF Transcript_8426/g.21520 Transcript_8426/m.21520 type:complete len:303 (+) Transcript_8426:856-1764(+)
MAIVQRRTVGPGPTDACVSHESGAAVVVAPVPEEGLKLVLPESGLAVLHDCKMSLARHDVDVTHKLNFGVRLKDSRLDYGVEESSTLVDGVLCLIRKVGLNGSGTGVRVDSVNDVQGGLHLAGPEKGWELVMPLDLIHFVRDLEVFECPVLPHPDLVLIRQALHEQCGPTCLNIDDAVRPRFADPKQVMEVRLLAEDGLVVAVVTHRLLGALDQQHRPRWDGAVGGKAKGLRPRSKAVKHIRADFGMHAHLDIVRLGQGWSDCHLKCRRNAPLVNRKPQLLCWMDLGSGRRTCRLLRCGGGM